MRGSAIAVLLALCAGAALADGGRVRLREDSGRFAVTVFTAPEPLAVGPADVSVLVQDRQTGEVLLDASVDIVLTGPDGGPPRVARAVAGANRLLNAATVTFDQAGAWKLEVVAARAGEAVRVSCSLPVGPPVSPLASEWPFLAFPPVAVALFAVRGAIRRRAR